MARPRRRGGSAAMERARPPGHGHRLRLAKRAGRRAMEGYAQDTYGEKWSPVFDDLTPDHPDTRASADRLVEWAASGPVLELGIGTGRVALPIAERAVEVHGIDVSPAMLARLAAKPGAEAVSAWTADMASFTCDVRYSLVYVLAST